MNKYIKIGKPYIQIIESKALLCSLIETPQMSKVLFYEVSQKFADYFLVDRCDCFLLGLLHTAMFENYDIECEAPITEELFFQLTNFYIPTLSSNMSDMNSIHIYGKTIPSPIEKGDGVLTGNSGGVDSLYTILKYTKEKYDNFGVTHIIFNNIYFEDNNAERMRKLFERDCIEKSQLANETNLEFISLFTNLYEFYKHPGIFNHYFALQYIGAAYCLAKLFKVFYFSSSFPVNKFSINEKEIVSSARFDIFTLDCASTSFLKIYSAGTEVDRLEKMNFICDKPETKKHLQVCAVEQGAGYTKENKKFNCGFCNKCGRTISLLYARNLLNEYEPIFDLTYFYTNKAKFIGRTLATDQKLFSKIVKSELKRNKILPFGTSFWEIMYSLRYKISKNKFLVIFYQKIRKNKNV
jgi:hypothetical protein